MRAPKEIKAEIAALKKLKPKIRQYSAFGGDNHACVDAQIEVLESDMNADDIYNRADEGIAAEEELWNDNVRDSAEVALKWKLGESFVAPSVDWEPLIRKS